MSGRAARAPRRDQGLPFAGRAVLVAAAVVALAGAAALAAGLPATDDAGGAGARPDSTQADQPGGAPVPAPAAGGDAVPPVAAATAALPFDPASLAERAVVGSGPVADARRDLLEWAEEVVGREARPVRDLSIDDPESAFADDAARAYGLALAHRAGGDERYGRASADIVRAWSTENDRLEGACPDDGSCQTSLFISRNAPGLVFATELLDGTGFLTAEDRTGFDRWLREVILPAASVRTNNWGDAGTFLRIAATAHLGDERGLRAAVTRWRELIDLVAADGHIPEEVRRGRESLQYSQEALLYKVAAAEIAARHGHDLWSYRGTGGATLADALHLVARGLADPSTWAWHPDPDVPTPAPLWEIAAARQPHPAWVALAAERRPSGSRGHSAIRWTTYTAAPLGGAR